MPNVICTSLLNCISDYSVANAALKNLNGKFLKGRRISVQPANSNYNSKSDFWRKVAASKESLKGLNLPNSSNSSEVSKEDKIRAIEAKLKALEKGEVCQQVNFLQKNKCFNANLISRDAFIILNFNFQDAFQVAVGKPKPHHINRPTSSLSNNHHSIKMKTSSKSSTGNSSSKLYNSKSKTHHHSKPYQKSSHCEKR